MKPTLVIALIPPLCAACRAAPVIQQGTPPIATPPAPVDAPPVEQFLWNAMPALFLARTTHVSATGPDGRIYIFGGSTQTNNNPPEQAFEPSVNVWFNIAQMPTRIQAGATRGHDGNIYIVGGTTTAPTATVVGYNTTSGSYFAVPSMTVARSGVVVATGADGRIYAIGGTSGGGVSNRSAEVFTPGDTVWRPIAAPTQAHINGATALGPDGRIYAIAGVDSNQATALVEAYDPASDQWTFVMNLPAATSFLAAVSSGALNTIYISGGLPVGASNASDALYELDVSRGALYPRRSMLTPRSGHEMVVAGTNNRLYVTGGTNNSTPELASMEMYGPQRFPPPTARVGGPYSSNANKVVVFDGSATTNPSGNPSALLYSWNFGDGTTSTLKTPYAYHSYGAFNLRPITLTVTDNTGQVSTSSTQVTVTPGAPTVTAHAANGTTLFQGETFTLPGTVTSPSFVPYVTVNYRDGSVVQLPISGGNFTLSHAFGPGWFLVATSARNGNQYTGADTTSVLVWSPNDGMDFIFNVRVDSLMNAGAITYQTRGDIYLNEQPLRAIVSRPNFNKQAALTALTTFEASIQLMVNQIRMPAPAGAVLLGITARLRTSINSFPG